MKRIFLIGWKDVRLMFRDPGALVLMLLAPFLLTIGMGFVTGRFTNKGGASGIINIPVIIVNQDTGQLGQALVEMFQSDDLKSLVITTTASDPGAARAEVDADKQAASVVIPAGFTDSIMPKPGSVETTAPVQIELYLNPARPNSAGVVKAIVEQFINQVEIGRVSGAVAVGQLIKSGLLAPQDAAQAGAAIGARQAQTDTRVTGLRSVTSEGQAVQMDVMAYMAPAMALFFLMYTVTNAGRTLYLERLIGTLPRLLVTPTHSAQVLAGKVFGIFMTGTAQMLILIVASTLLFGLRWGNPAGVLALVVTAVIGALGWGLLITAIAKTPGQVGAIGSAVMLTFGILGGSFIDVRSMPGWFQKLSLITPNAWGINGFSTLAGGGSLADIWQPMLGLVVMGGVLFAVAVLIINRRGIIQR